VGFHSLTTTIQPPNVHLQGSNLPLGCLPVKSLSAGENRAQDPLVRDTTVTLHCKTVPNAHQTNQVLTQRRQKDSAVLLGQAKTSGLELHVTGSKYKYPVEET